MKALKHNGEMKFNTLKPSEVSDKTYGAFKRLEVVQDAIGNHDPGDPALLVGVGFVLEDVQTLLIEVWDDIEPVAQQEAPTDESH